MGKLGRLGLEPAVRYERDRPGELVHIDIKKLGRITVVVPLVVVVVTMVALAQGGCGNGTPTGVSAPSGSVQTMGEMVRYLEQYRDLDGP